MKLIVAGSRDITDYELLKYLVVKSGFWKHKTKLEIVCGMALYWKWHEYPLIGGVDRLGYNLAQKNNLPLHKYPADWKRHGKVAGNIRNKQMGDNADALLALWDGQSPGTKNMIEYARQKRLIVKAYKCTKYKHQYIGDVQPGYIWAIEEV